MKRVILQENKGKLYYTVQSPIKILGITLGWYIDICETPVHGGILVEKAMFDTLEKAQKYIMDCYNARVFKIK